MKANDFRLDNTKILAMNESFLVGASKVHARVFSRQTLSQEWLSCNFLAYPRMMIFVAYFNELVIGYVHWAQKSGFRKEAVLELEQIAVDPDYQGLGVGTKLIESSILMVRDVLGSRGASIKHFMVSTRTDNEAQRLYIKTLNVKQAAVISDLYSADEVIMVS